jgi:hypothetical protein
MLAKGVRKIGTLPIVYCYLCYDSVQIFQVSKTWKVYLRKNTYWF